MELTKEEIAKFDVKGLNRINVYPGDGIDPNNPEHRQKVIDAVNESVNAIAAGDYLEVTHYDDDMPQCEMSDYMAKNWRYRMWKIRDFLWTNKRKLYDWYKWKEHKVKFKLLGNYHLGTKQDR